MESYCDVCGSGDRTAHARLEVCPDCQTEADAPEYMAWWADMLVEMQKDGIEERHVDKFDWLWYFRDGYSPREALDEDYSNA